MMKSFVSTALMAVMLTACQCATPVGTACKAQTDCTDGTSKYCATALLVCVECLEDANCRSGFVCNPEGRCEAGCRSDSDRCLLGQVCKAGSGCVECLTDAQCGPGRLCSATNTCVAGCSAASPACPAGQVCDAQQGQCAECTANANCLNPSRPVCDPQAKTCVECVGNGDCHDASRPQCEAATHVCVACVSDAQCPAGKVCAGNACVAGCSATHACPGAAVCDPATSQCVQCVSDAQCTAAGATKCDSTSHTCVQCSAGPSDACPVGQYCRADHVCEQGCKSTTDCPAGVCKADHSCSNCAGDAQCAAGQVCAAGACIEACSKTAPCGSGKECCAGHCADTAVDNANCGACNVSCGSNKSCCSGSCAALTTPTHCGACGITCAAGQGCCAGACTPTNSLTNCGGCGIACSVDQFCDGTVCRDQVFPQFCANKKVYAILDNVALDQAATNTLVSTIQTNCSAQTQIQTGAQTNAAWVDQTTGALLLGGGSTVVTAGGPFPNMAVKWLERTRKATKVYFANNVAGTEFYFKRRSDDVVLVTWAQATCSATPKHDVFVAELVTDPTSGTLALIAYGLCGGGYGTQTGAWYWANTMMPNLNAYPDSWYLVEWLDTNGDTLPSATDTFTILSHGR